MLLDIHFKILYTVFETLYMMRKLYCLLICAYNFILQCKVNILASANKQSTKSILSNYKFS